MKERVIPTGGNDVASCLELVRRYASGRWDTPLDTVRARQYGQRALELAESGADLGAIAGISREDFKVLYNNAYYGDPEACMKVAILYAVGSPTVFKDREEARTWMSRAVDYYAGKEPHQRPSAIKAKKEARAVASQPKKSKTYHSTSRQSYSDSGLGDVAVSATKSLCNGLSWVVGILGGLYVISPIDIVPDTIPVAGWADDVGVGGAAVLLILILQCFPKIVELLNEIIRWIKNSVVMLVIISVALIGILGVLIYKYLIVG